MHPIVCNGNFGGCAILASTRSPHHRLIIASPSPHHRLIIASPSPHHRLIVASWVILVLTSHLRRPQGVAVRPVRSQRRLYTVTYRCIPLHTVTVICSPASPVSTSATYRYIPLHTVAGSCSPASPISTSATYRYIPLHTVAGTCSPASPISTSVSSSLSAWRMMTRVCRGR